MLYPTYCAAQAAYRTTYEAPDPLFTPGAYAAMSTPDLETIEYRLLDEMPTRWHGTLPEVRLAFIQAELETRQETIDAVL